jgi:hypothetical protein
MVPFSGAGSDALAPSMLFAGLFKDGARSRYPRCSYSSKK